MAEYIKREAIRNALYEADAITMQGVVILNEFPAADVVPMDFHERSLEIEIQKLFELEEDNERLRNMWAKAVSDLSKAKADVVEPKRGEWISLTDCANAGVYCSVCHKKVWKEDYARCNRENKLRSNFCPNCGSDNRPREASDNE